MSIPSGQLLAGRAAIVVGGSRGVGAAVAALLAARGAAVVVNGRDREAAEQIARNIIADGGRAVAYTGSASDEATAKALTNSCIDEFGSLNVLVNCAGIAEPASSSILQISTAQFHELLNAHLGTVFQTCRAAAPSMVAQGGGSIVNTGSVAFLGDYGGTGYPAGKGAVNSLTLAIAAELKQHRVRANVVCPGARTRLSSGPEYEARILGLHRRGMLDEVSMRGSLDVASPDYVAPLYVYLASHLADQVTGQMFVAAGGFVGRLPRTRPAPLGFRDHHDSPPWSVEELSGMVGGRAEP